MSHRGGGAEKCQKSVAYYLNGPYCQIMWSLRPKVKFFTTLTECNHLGSYTYRKRKLWPSSAWTNQAFHFVVIGKCDHINHILATDNINGLLIIFFNQDGNHILEVPTLAALKDLRVEKVRENISIKLTPKFWPEVKQNIFFFWLLIENMFIGAFMNVVKLENAIKLWPHYTRPVFLNVFCFAANFF